MATFIYTATDQAGKFSRGELEAATRKAALNKLRQRDLLVLEIEERKEKVSWWQRTFKERKIAELDKIMFIRHLSILTKAGLTVVESLDVLAKQPSTVGIARIINHLNQEIKEGNNLADSMKRYPKNFPEFVVSIVAVGEKSGTLDKSLVYLADQLYQNYELKKKVKGAMIYPLAILFFVVSLSVGLVTFILPRIIPMFESLRIELPAPTRALIATMKFFAAHGVLLSILGIALLVLLIALFRAPALKPFWHRLTLALPFFGSFIKDLNLTRFSSTLGTMLKSGTPIVQSLGVTRNVLANQQYKAALGNVSKQVEKGSALATALALHRKLFPVLLVAMIQVGEASGMLEEILHYLTEFYDTRVDAATQGLAKVVGPLLLIIMGILVGGVALAIVMPIYQLPGSLVK